MGDQPPGKIGAPAENEGRENEADGFCNEAHEQKVKRFGMAQDSRFVERAFGVVRPECAVSPKSVTPIRRYHQLKREAMGRPPSVMGTGREASINS